MLALAANFGQVLPYLMPEYRAASAWAAHGLHQDFFDCPPMEGFVVTPHPAGMRAGGHVPDGPAFERLGEIASLGEDSRFNEANWERYFPLFTDDVEVICRKLAETQAAYADVPQALTSGR